MRDIERERGGKGEREREVDIRDISAMLKILNKKS